MSNIRITVSLAFLLALVMLVGVIASPARAEKQMVDDQTKAALIAAINDEYKARATYAKIIEKFGPQKPFINIIDGEARHAQMIKDVMIKYGLTVPEDVWTAKVNAPDSMLAACQEAIVGEKENVAMYDRFIAATKEDDIKELFVYLRDASANNHLPAFERCVARGGEMGPGKGMGQGRGPGGGQGR